MIRPTTTRLYQLFCSDRNTWLARQLIVSLVVMILMGTMMGALFDVARVVRPVTRIEAFLGIDGSHRSTAASSISGPADPQ